MRATSSAAVLGFVLLLGVFLGSPSGDHATISAAPQPPATPATPADFEVDVLSGIRTTSMISDGWHQFRSPTTQPPAGFSNEGALDFAHVESRDATIGMPVDAAFRQMRGPALKAVIDPLVNRRHLGCEGLIVILHDSSRATVAHIQYYHLAIPEALKPTAISYTWDLSTGGATTSSFDGMRDESSGNLLRRQHLGTLLSADSRCDTTGPHLHQRVLTATGGTTEEGEQTATAVETRRDTTINRTGHADFHGRPYPCMGPDRWLWKLWRGTDPNPPTPTAPTTTCPGADTAPEFDDDEASYTFRVDTAVSETLPAADRGGDGTLSYSLRALSGTAAPGLTFTAATRVLAGTPTTAGTYTYTYTVSDSDSNTAATDQDTMRITVNVASAPLPTLRALSLSDVTLNRTFASDTLKYTGVADASLSQTTVAATATDSTATVDITPDDADNDATNGHQVNLTAGPTKTEITATVTAADGVTSSAYTVTVCRPAGRPGETQTDISYGLTSWTYPDEDDVTYERRLVTRQPQRRTVTWNATACDWSTTPWQNVGIPTVAWERTSNSKVAPKPDPTRPGTPTPTGVTWWTYPDADDVTYEWRGLSRQPERRTVTWNATNGTWTRGQWEDDGDPVASSEATGNSKEAPKPKETRPGEATPTGVTWWTYPDAEDVTYEWRELSRQPERHTVTWNRTNGTWTEGEWEPDGDPIKSSEATGNSKTARKPAFTDSTVLDTNYQWDIRGTTPNRVAHYQKNEQTQDWEWATDWGSATGTWVNGRWEKDGDPYWTGWTDTSVTDPEIVLHETRERVLTTWYAWETEGDGIVVCWLQRYRYERIQVEHWSTTSSWGGSGWVMQWYLNFVLGETVRKTAVGNIVPISCTGARSQMTSPFLIGGDYVFTWGGTSVSFTVPADVTIDLAWRVLDSGVRAAVLTDDGAGEVLVYPGAAAARGAQGSGADTRSADLQAIETTIAEAQSAAATPASNACAVVSSNGPAAAAIDLGAGGCASVPEGGAVQITVGEDVLSLTLTADRSWLVARLDAGGSARVALFDIASTSLLVLNPGTGAEVQRTIPDGAEAGIGPIFDAIVTSATPPPAEDAGS